MKVLVTGGAGFIGSHIVDALIKENHTVTVVDNLSQGKLEQVHQEADFYQIDICSPELIKLIKKAAPEVIIHQAAQIKVNNSIEDPIFDARVNLIGTLNLLESAAQCGVRKITYASSAAVYGEPAYLAIDEDHPVNPISPYGVSKYAPEMYLKHYKNIHNLDYTVLRYANVYGPRQDASGEGGVVALFCDRLIQGETLTIHGDGEQTRDFIYVGDVASANLATLTKGDGSIYNVGCNRPTSINELTKILSHANHQSIKTKYTIPRPGDIKESYLNSIKAQRELDWKPQWSLHKGLAETLGSYRKDNRHLRVKVS
ncbi:NAD-dependent epimerase/dehydratase family protein [Heliorestis convoluta]|uniref:3-beta hydroxysteroid dehydrogenase/isomerase family protein n=1 Tax=Heliorestis convoluta TaxID=356322 RepID=A0A5Q2N3N6_9FIRM|nr:NAD-dependent epimerase/dehydratase family protein [Heliorestis convoluta]QGG47195.1 3-beta hydroxysteroid dehydrogenase/isomerase family protein [Heliorestis convoluta]